MATAGPTRIGVVLDRLLAIARDVLEPEVQVIDGVHLGELMLNALAVGFTDGPDRPGYTTDYVEQPGMRSRLREDFTVRMLLTVSSGSTQMKPLRDRAVGYLAELDAALRAERRDDDAWDRAQISGDADWIPVQHTQGATLNVIFTIVGASLL